MRECYSDVRELLVHFRTRTSEEDIEAALRATLSKFEHQTGMATSLSMAGHGVPCRPMCRSRCCTWCRKPCRMSAKHAKATRVELRVERHPRWRFEVQDDGMGFEVEQVPPDSLHVGLGIMRERAQRIGAVVQVQSHRGQGTRVCIELPSSPRPPAPANATASPAQAAPVAAAPIAPIRPPLQELLT